jgi:hypothetical protein
MTSPERESLDSILDELDRVDPISFDLGTPEVMDVDPLRELVALGPPIVPALLRRLRDPDAPAKRTAYLVLALNRLGDARALPTVRMLREDLQQRERKDEWDHATLGQCDLAIARLEASKGPR